LLENWSTGVLENSETPVLRDPEIQGHSAALELPLNSSQFRKKSMTNSFRRALTRLLLVIGMVFSIGWGAVYFAHAAQWSATDPPINETHLFSGEINKRGRPVGFHARPAGRDPANARVVKIDREPNRFGVYEARVEIRKSFFDKWLSKRSTMFPDTLSRQMVIEAVLNAYRNRTTEGATKFRGPSGLGFTVEGYLLPDGRINTAYPIFQ
jgi:Bacterial EndoU nuclease